MIPPVPGEETPLLDGETVSATRRIVERESEAAALAGPSNFSPTLGIKSRKNISGRSRIDVVNKTPLPWVQFSITLLLLFAELLASYVISPVSSLVGFPPYLLLCDCLTPALDDLIFHSLHPRSVWAIAKSTS